MKNNRRQLVRQWQLVRALGTSRFGLRVPQLLEKLECSKPTLYRDLRLLEQAGVPITKSLSNGEARYRLLRESELPPLGLSALQITALHLARAELEPLAGTGLVREIDALLTRLRPEDKQQTLPFAVRGREVPPQQAATMRAVDQALARRCRVKIHYRAAKNHGATSVLQIEPLFVNVAKGDPYLRAYCVDRDDERTYKIARITQIEVTSDPATYRPPHPPEQSFSHSVKAWHGAPGTVKIRLDTEIAWLAREYPLIRGQRIESHRDGSATIEANVAGVTEAARWVLSWGGAAEALSPPELRAAVRSELTRALEKYSRPGVVPVRRASAKRRGRSSHVR